MKRFKVLVSIAAVVVLPICIYSFLLGNEVFGGKLENVAFGGISLQRESFVHWRYILLVGVLEASQRMGFK